MEFRRGQKIILNGDARQIRQSMQYLSTAFYREGRDVLLIDTTNSLNLHSKAYNDSLQDQYFKYIYCVRTQMPYDLWARLGTSGSFIKKNRINVILINSLSLLFKDAPVHEVEPLLMNILDRLDRLTKEYDLITVIGNSPSENESAMTAFDILSGEQNVQEVS